MREQTFTVASMPDCITVLQNERHDDPRSWETQVGCKVLLLLQEIHKFNITYTEDSYYYNEKGLYVDVDIYAKPRSLWSPIMFNCTPIAPVMDWKFGYILRPVTNIRHFYSLAFSTPAWNVLGAMILLVSVLFHILNRAEQKLSGENLKCYFWRDLLIAFGIICQHYISINPMELTSRRIAFISFSLFSYIIYCYYTSTLLSDLVHDRDNEMDLDSLAESDYKHAVLDTVASIIKNLVEQLHNDKNKMSPERLIFIENKLINHHVVNISTGLAGVKTGKTALLSDYVSIHSAVVQSFTQPELCDLIKVDMFSNVVKYLVTSKNFKYIEEFKISTLRAKEAGVLQRLLTPHTIERFPHTCASSLFQAHIVLVRKPFILLALGYVLCGFIVLAERVHYNRYKVWPYVN